MTALVTHGLVLLNDGHYVDGWPTYTQLAERNWDVLFTHLYRAGLPGTVLFYSVMDYFPGLVVKYRVATIIAILLVAVLVYRMAEASRCVTRWESVTIALFAVTYPAFQTWVITPVELYVVFYALFILAAYLALGSEQATGPRRYVLRACSLILFALSFNINSLLPFYFGALLFLLILGPGVGRGMWLRASMAFVAKHVDFVVLPFVFWVLKERLYPRYGDYAEYNPFKFSPGAWTVGVGRFLVDAVFGQLNDAMRIVLQQPAVSSLLVLTLYAAMRSFAVPAARPGEQRHPSAPLKFGLVLFALGIFPYVVVGVAPALHGFATRHALLVALPIAIVLTGVIRLLAVGRDGRLSKAGLAMVAILVVAFSLTLVDNYFAWQARWAKDRSVMVNLAKVSAAKEISVFWIDDEFPVPGVNEYAMYDWSSMFKQIWGGESRVGLSQHLARDGVTDEITTWALYNLSELDKAGCQATLNIRRGHLASPDPWRLAAHYLSIRLFKPAEMTRFLEGVTRIRVERISAREAVNCRS